MNEEKPKKINYPDYKPSWGNNEIKHVKAQVANVTAPMDEIFPILDKDCANEYNRQMALFKMLIKSIVFYSKEIWEYENMNKLRFYTRNM